VSDWLQFAREIQHAILNQWGAFGAIFVLAIVALRALFGRYVASQEARIRDLQFCEQINASLLTILGFVRQIQQQGRSRSNMERRVRDRADGKT
jgi:hypothetical protein